MLSFIKYSKKYSSCPERNRMRIPEYIPTFSPRIESAYPFLRLFYESGLVQQIQSFVNAVPSSSELKVNMVLFDRSPLFRKGELFAPLGNTPTPIKEGVVSIGGFGFQIEWEENFLLQISLRKGTFESPDGNGFFFCYMIKNPTEQDEDKCTTHIFSTTNPEEIKSAMNRVLASPHDYSPLQK